MRAVPDRPAAFPPMPSFDSFRQRLRALGAAPVHEERVLRRWLQARDQQGGRQAAEHFLPAAVRSDLPALLADLDGLARLQSEHPGEDGSARLLVALADGQTVESVLMPPGRIPGLCVSTQVGCAVGCVFCMTGRSGLLRQLGSAEILAQVALARRLRPVRKVVFMGMGEPAHNLDAVMEAIEALGTLGGIGHKELVFSTVGDARVFERLPQGPVKPALALSLHSSQAAKRERLLPRAPRITPDDLVAEGERYARATGHPIQYQWTLIAGVNDGDDELEGIARLLSGRHAMMNLIPYNTTEAPDDAQWEGPPLRRPDGERAAEMARSLNRRGIYTRLRRSAGQDVDGGCGQLRARVLNSAGNTAAAIAPLRLLRRR